MIDKIVMNGVVYDSLDCDFGCDVFMDGEDGNAPVAYPSYVYDYEMEIDGFRFVLPKTAHDFATLAHKFTSYPCTDHYMQVSGWEQPHYIVLAILRGDVCIDAFEIHDGGKRIVPAYEENLHVPSEAAIAAIQAWCHQMGLSTDC